MADKNTIGEFAFTWGEVKTVYSVEEVKQYIHIDKSHIGKDIEPITIVIKMRYNNYENKRNELISLQVQDCTPFTIISIAGDMAIDHLKTKIYNFRYTDRMERLKDNINKDLLNLLTTYT